MCGQPKENNADPERIINTVSNIEKENAILEENYSNNPTTMTSNNNFNNKHRYQLGK